MSETLPRVAILHDWLNGMRGGEKVLEQLCILFPNAPVFTLHHELETISDTIKNHDIHASWIQRLPFKKKFYRYYLPLFPIATKSFKLHDYDLVISVSHCAVKNTAVPKNVCHLSYILSPMRYLWSMRDDYFREKSLLKILSFPFIGALKRWDSRGSNSVYHHIAISKTIQQRVHDCYGKEASLVYPPCDIPFQPMMDKKNYLLILSAFVPYKRLDLAILACNALKMELVIAGAGPEEAYLKKLAGPTITFKGFVSESEKIELLKYARALLFPGLEDFGIVPLEAMAFATPVVGYGVGGLTETVKDGLTGLFFKSQDCESITKTIEKLEHTRFQASNFEEALRQFSNENFKITFKNVIMKYFEKWKKGG